MNDLSTGQLLCRLLAAAPPAEVGTPPPDPAVWAAVVARARREGLAALLAWRLRERGLAVPPPVHEVLERGYYLTASLNARISRQLADVLHVLASSGVEPVVLKGAHVAQTAYANPALRPIGDLDLLIPAANLAAAEAALRREGYQPLAPYAWRQERLAREHCHSAPLFRPGDPTTIELHWALVPPGTPFHLNPEELRERSEHCRLGEAPARVLATPDLLLHLGVHLGGLDLFSAGLRPLCDVAAVVRQAVPTLDWDTARARAGAAGAGRAWRACLCLARDLFGAPVPEGAEGPAEDGGPDVIPVIREYLLAGLPVTLAAARRAGVRYPGPGRSGLLRKLSERWREYRLLPGADRAAYRRYYADLARRTAADCLHQWLPTAAARQSARTARQLAEIARWVQAAPPA